MPLLSLECLDRILHLLVVDVLVAAPQRQVEALAQQRDVGMLHAELELRTLGQLDAGRLGAGLRLGRGAAARLDERLAQQLELRMLGMQELRGMHPGVSVAAIAAIDLGRIGAAAA